MIAALTRTLRRLAHDRTGTPAVEFALTVPALATLIFGVIQFGMAFTAYAGVRNAVEVGARYATVFTGQANTASCGGTLTRTGYPTNAEIQAKVTANSFGVDRTQLSTPTVTLGNSNGACFVEVSLTYPIAISLGLVNLPAYTMSYSRRVYQQ